MAEKKRYDGELQMFVEESRDPDLNRLTFLRWLVEQRNLEHGPAGAPAGIYATEKLPPPSLVKASS